MFSDIERKLFVLKATCCWRESENFSPFLERIIFGDHICRKKVSSTFFPEFEQKIVKRPTILFRRNCKSRILRFRMNNLGENLFGNFFSAHCFSGFWKKKFSNFNQNVSAGLWKLHFFVTRGLFSRETLFMEFANLYSYSGYELKIFGVWAESFRRGCKNCIRLVRGNFLRKKKFLKVHNFKINFGLLKKIFHLSSGIWSNVVIYAFYVSRWTFQAPNFFWTFYEFVCSSGCWAEKCRPSGKKVSAGFSKFCSICPEDQY